MRFLNIVCACALFSCSVQEVRLHSDFHPEGRFMDYTHFTFIPSKEPFEELESAITQRLHALGFQYGRSEHDLYIAYSLLEGEGNLLTYDQPAIDYWLATSGRETAIRSQNTKKLKGKILILSFFDPEVGEMVWRGMMSTEHSHFHSVQSAAYLILDDFRVHCRASRHQEEVARNF